MKYKADKGQEELLKRITSLLHKEKIPYMVTGSVSVIFYGRPRASHDIDFVIEISKENLKKVVETFLSLPFNEFLVDKFQIENAFQDLHQFNILHLPTMLKLDFWLLTDESFDQERFKRRKELFLFEQPMDFASPEDTILKKLLWYQDSKLEKHLIDAAFVYQIQEKNLNKNYLFNWAKKQKTQKILEELSTIDLLQYY